MVCHFGGAGKLRTTTDESFRFLWILIEFGGELTLKLVGRFLISAHEAQISLHYVRYDAPATVTEEWFDTV
jgi:hypothetical protein